MKSMPWILAGLLFAATSRADPPAPSAQAILGHVLETDPFGFSGGSVVARLTLTDKSGSKSNLAFTSKSKRLGPGLAESIVRFSEPSDLAGAGFLQVQKKDGDDDRYLYLPDLKRSRRISASLRSNAFMGTDLSYADLDRRDFRDNVGVTLTGNETIENWECFVLDVVPSRQDSQYSHAEFWVRKDNYLPLRIKFYDRAKTLTKVFTALEVRRVSGQWFISKSRTTSPQQNHTTDLSLEQIAASDQFSDDDFTVRALEKSQ